MSQVDRKFLHDISNPLASLYMYVEGLHADSTAKGLNDYTTRLQKCLALLAKIEVALKEKKEALKALE